MHMATTAYIIKCGFGADNQVLQSASTSVFFDRKVPRNPPLIIYAERWLQSPYRLEKQLSFYANDCIFVTAPC